MPTYKINAHYNDGVLVYISTVRVLRTHLEPMRSWGNKKAPYNHSYANTLHSYVGLRDSWKLRTRGMSISMKESE